MTLEVREPSAKYLVDGNLMQTEVGNIPSHWTVKPLLSVVRIANGQVDPKVEPYRSMTLVAPDHIEVGTGRLLAKVSAAEQNAISGKYMFDAGDIIYSKIRPYLRKVIVADFKGLCSADMYPLKPENEISGGFIHATLLGERFTKYADSVSVRSGMPKINRSELAEFKLGLPPQSEQRAIATALSDVDALIAGLERLIAKKRDIKQAAMQQLLTGQTRLPGFRGEWRLTTFGSVVRHHSGNSALIKGKLSSSDAVGLYPGFSASGQDVWLDRYEHEGDAIVVSAVGSRCGKAFAASGQWSAIANTHVVWPDKKQIDKRYLGFFINDEDFWLKSGSGQPFVLFKQTFARQLRLSTLDEQQSISVMLFDIDHDLAVNESRLTKTRAIKQGMMQELLTGRIRLLETK